MYQGPPGVPYVGHGAPGMNYNRGPNVPPGQMSYPSYPNQQQSYSGFPQQSYGGVPPGVRGQFISNMEVGGNVTMEGAGNVTNPSMAMHQQ